MGNPWGSSFHEKIGKLYNHFFYFNYLLKTCISSLASADAKRIRSYTAKMASGINCSARRYKIKCFADVVYNLACSQLLANKMSGTKIYFFQQQQKSNKQGLSADVYIEGVRGSWYFQLHFDHLLLIRKFKQFFWHSTNTVTQICFKTKFGVYLFGWTTIFMPKYMYM